jgi:hypothetical protein
MSRLPDLRPATEKLARWPHRYNGHRSRGGLKSMPPISKLGLNRNSLLNNLGAAMDTIENNLLADPILLTLSSVVALSVAGLLICGICWLARRRR